MGFDYFYGFMGGDTSQWTPGNLFRNTTQIYPYETQKGFNLITAMADEAIDYMAQLNTLAPDAALARLLCPRRHPCAAPPDAGVDRRRSAT